MSEATGITFDMTQFQKFWTEAAKVSKRTLAESANHTAFSIAIEARNQTPKAERGTIEAALNVTGYKVIKSRKTGAFKRGRAIFAAAAGQVANIVWLTINARRRRAGEKGLYGAKMAAAASAFAGRRFRAMGTLRAGWSQAIYALAKVVPGFKPADTEKLPRNKQRGGATPAVEGWSPEATFGYGEFVKKGPTGRRISEVPKSVVAATERAFAIEQVKIEAYTARKMQEAMDGIRV